MLFVFDTKKDLDNDPGLNVFVVRLEGFEPPTHCLEVRRPYFSFFFMYFYYLVFLDSYKCHILHCFSSFGIILSIKVGNRVGK